MTAQTRWRARGEAAGARQAWAIRANLARFRRVLAWRGWTWTALLDRALRQQRRLPHLVRAEILGMADGASVPAEALLAYNLFAEWADPEGCTVALAMPDATRGGELIFLKNSDKMGAAEAPPDRWHLHKEINVVRIVEGDPEAGTRKVIGVAAAGSTIFKMGLNDAGVCGGASLGRIIKGTEQTAAYWGAAGRGELLRDGLRTAATAEEAAAMCLPALVRTPVASPGNIQFADPTRAVNLECSFTEAAVEWITSGIMVRTNRFELMRQLNRPDDTSSAARHARATDILQRARGAIDAETMRALSMDHANGPSPESICRHSADWREETSLSAAIMRVSPQDGIAEIAIALGKPCWAWPSREGSLRLTTAATEADVPPAFLTGEAWKQHYAERAREVTV